MFIENKLDITWKCSSRLDTIDEEMIKIMAEAGCKRIFFGIETGSKQMQKLIKKNLKLDALPTLLKNLKAYGINAAFCFIYGFPEETEADVNDTLALMYKIHEEYRGNSFSRMLELQLFMLSFLPKTQLSKKYFNQLEYEEEHFSHFIGFYSLMEMDETIDSSIWDYTKIIAKKKEIFTQHYEYKSEIRIKLKNLDKYYLLILPKILKNLDLSYKLILEFFKGNHVQLYLEFNNFLCKDHPDMWSFKNITSNLGLFDSIAAFGRFIDYYDFGNEKKLISQMYNIETNIIELIHNKSNDYFVENTYDFDVYNMKKNRSTEVINRKNILKFIRNESKYYIEQEFI